MVTGLIVSQFLSIIQLYFYIVPQEEKQVRVGLDIGSTTIKCAVLDEHDALIYSTYERHYSHILEKAQELLRRIDAEHLHGNKALLSISGSAGMGLADSCGVPFVQEVFSTRVAVKRFVPATDCVIELGGEDAKILFLTNGTEVRMNGSCAGGTGAFIDQMATLLKMSADEMNKAAEKAERTYTIASRCGVFAKSDVQPLINQGARTEDIAASIYKAVVNQTIAGLAQGRPIKGNILYLGGPLTFSTVLRKSFDEALGVTGTCPENSLLYVALGAALLGDQFYPECDSGYHQFQIYREKIYSVFYYCYCTDEYFYRYASGVCVYKGCAADQCVWWTDQWICHQSVFKCRHHHGWHRLYQHLFITAEGY